jgi:branched-chain amino acid transport system substrate-binding protein
MAGALSGAGLAATRLGGLGAARAQTGPVRIACLQTLTGSLADIGKAHLLGIRIAVDQVNKAGGVDGRQVELVVRDTKFSPAEAVGSLRELAGDGVNLVVGEAFTNVNLATVPLAPQLNVVIVSPTTIAMELTHEMFNRNFFRCGPNAFMQYNGETVLMAKQQPGVARWGGVQGDSAGFKVGWDMMTATLKRNYQKFANKQIEILDPVLVKSGATDFRTQVNELVGAKPEGLIVMLGGGEAVTFLRQAKPFKLLQQVKAVADNNLNVTAGPTLKQDMPNNFFTSCMWQLDAYKQYPMAEGFAKDWIAETKDNLVNPYSANSHTAVMSLVAGVKAAKATDSNAVVAALESITFDSVYGPLQYRKEDHQLKVGPGYMELAPQEGEPGWRMVRFVRVPWEDAIEPPTPGVAFAL